MCARFISLMMPKVARPTFAALALEIAAPAELHSEPRAPAGGWTLVQRWESRGCIEQSVTASAPLHYVTRQAFPDTCVDRDRPARD
ncbi:hypothetical protein CEXT_211681 [Caerostris extrusa]|uniref:Uncharacterized protein n=1 Tax=Caerostris extrusa TaxID=172846 RepID=A0AAV4PY83_CAEEX|nr:hypothetical protein CEXT_211681 [Caerostris extrusa]